MKKSRAKSIAAISLLLAILLTTGALHVQGGGFVHTSHGPYGGVVQAMMIGLDGTMYAGVYQGWTFRSTDGGENWIRSKQGIPNSARNIQAMAASSTGPVYGGSAGGGVFKSTNSGLSWMAMNSGLVNLHVKSLLVDPNIPTTVYVGTSGSGVYEWTSSGPWQAKNDGALAAIVRVLAMDTAGTLYMGREDEGTAYGVYYWDGATWQARNAGLPANTTVCALLPDGTNLWAGTEGDGIYYWNGSTWAARNTGLPAGDARNACSLARDAGDQVYAGTADGFYVWTGTQWEARSGDLTGNGRYVRAIISPASGTLVIGTNGRGVFQSTDSGVNWADANNGLAGHVVRAVGINPEYDWRIYAGTYRGGVQLSVNGGESWLWWSEGLGDVEVETMGVTYPDGSPIYVGLNGQGVYRRDRVEFSLWTDWTPKNTGLSGTALIVNALAIKPNDSPVVFAGTEDGVYKSINAGETWADSSTGLNYAASALAIHPTNWDTIYAGTNLHGVYVSYNDGGQWAPLGSLSGDASQIFALTVDLAGTVYAGTRDGIYRYSGGAWEQDGLAETEIHTLVSNPLTETVVYAGTAEGTSPIGIVEKTPGGWLPMNVGLENLNVYALTIDDYYTQTLHAGTGGSSVWDYTFANALPDRTPEMGINLDDGVSVVHLGDLISYTVTYYNAGAVDATGVVVSVTIPERTDFVSSDAPFQQAQPRVYQLEVGLVEQEHEWNAHLVVQLSTEQPWPTILDAEASIWDDGASGPDPFLLNNQDEDIDSVEWGDLEVLISKEADPPSGSIVEPGSLITYTIRYENLGLLPGSQAMITDTYDAEGDYTVELTIPGPTNSYDGYDVWELGTLGPGASGAIQIVVRLNDTLPSNWPVANVATLDCSEGPPEDTQEVLHTVMNPPETLLTGLSAEDIHWPAGQLVPGVPTNFWVTIANNGNLDAADAFWVELYIKPTPSSPPSSAGDHDEGYCLSDCTVTRPDYVQLIEYLNQGSTFDVPFWGSELVFPAPGCYDLYAQVDVAFDAPEFNPFWGRYAENTEADNVWHETVCLDGGPTTIYLPWIVKRY